MAAIEPSAGTQNHGQAQIMAFGAIETDSDMVPRGCPSWRHAPDVNTMKVSNQNAAHPRHLNARSLGKVRRPQLVYWVSTATED